MVELPTQAPVVFVLFDAPPNAQPFFGCDVRQELVEGVSAMVGELTHRLSRPLMPLKKAP